MKKLLSLLMAAMLLPMALQALDLPSNQMVLGHYTTDDLNQNGWGKAFLKDLVLPIATDLTADELAMFQGSKIVAFRVGLAEEAPVTRVFVMPLDANGKPTGEVIEWPCNVSSQGWNMIELDTPYEINLPDGCGLRIGFDYEQIGKDTKPISAVKIGTTYATYHYRNGSWVNYGVNTMGNLSLQCIAENDNFPHYLLRATNLTCKNRVKTGDELQFSVQIYNLGTLPIAPGTLTFDISVDGCVFKTISNAENISTERVTIRDAINTDRLTSGEHTLAVNNFILNGEPIEEPIVLTTTFKNFDFGFSRQMHLVEQFTSTWCTYCPQGTANIQALTQMRGDIAWVAVHENMGNVDPFRTEQTDSITNYEGINGFPEASFNRTVGIENDSTVYAILTNLSASTMNSFLNYVDDGLSAASININSTFDVDTRKAHIIVNGELVPNFDEMMGADSKLTVYLTEDGLVAPQTNGGGNYVHNNVMRLALGSVKGVDINRTSDTTFVNEFSLDIPSDWNANNLNVIAFISRPLGNSLTDIYVTNAQKEKLGNANAPLNDYEFIVDGLYYHIIENNTVMVVFAESYFDDIVIPETVSYQGMTYEVTSIGDFAFYGCSPLSSVTIPVSVTSISSYAFAGSGIEEICVTGDGDWQAGALPNTVKTLYVNSGVTSIEGLNVNPAAIFCYSSNPTICDEMSFTGYNGTLHIPAESVAGYFIADYWCNFANIIGDAVELQSITMSQDSLNLGINRQKRLNVSIVPSDAHPSTISWHTSNRAIVTVDNGYVIGIAEGECDIVATCVGKQTVCHVIVTEVLPSSITLSQDVAMMAVGEQLYLTANVFPEDVTNKTVVWSSADDGIVTVDNGVVTALSPGECDIIVCCGEVQDTCHVTVFKRTVYITLDEHEVSVLPNHIISLMPTMTPEATDLKVTSSNPAVAAVRLVNNKVQVVGIKEGETTISVGSVDGTAVGDTCHVTVYTEVGDVNSDGYVKINDVSALIDYLFSGDESAVNISKADTNNDGKVSIADVSSLINYLLSGEWPWGNRGIICIDVEKDDGPNAVTFGKGM